MKTIRTSAKLRKCDASRLMSAGYEIDYIEILHRDTADDTTIVWSRPPRPNDIPEHEVPY
jgi:hypothetical protein